MKRKYTMGVKEMLTMNDYGNFAEEIPYFCFVTDENKDNGSVLLTNGCLLVTFEYRGRDLFSSTNSEMNQTIKQLSNALGQLEEGWSIHVDVIREKTDTYISNDLNAFGKNITADVLDEEGRSAYKGEENNIENIYYLSLCYLPPKDLINSVNKALYTSSDENKSVDKVYNEDFQKHKDTFFEISKRVIDYLCEGVSLTYFKVLDKKEMLSFLYKCITDEKQNFKITKEKSSFLQYLLSNKDVVVENYPKFGDKYVSCIAVYDLPHAVYPGIMDDLNNMQIEFRFNTRFVLLDNDKAMIELKRQVEKWKMKRKGILSRIAEAMNMANTKDDEYAMEQQAEVESQLKIVQNGEAKYGFYNSTILIFHKDLETLKSISSQIETKLKIREFSVKIEDINTFDSYMGSLPGKTYENLIRLPIFTPQLACLFPITAYWAGDFETTKNYCQNGGENPVLGYVKTNNNSPFRLTHHADDVGHTMIIGPAGSGKSTLLNFIASQHPRYKDSYIFHFDKGASSRVLNYAYNGLFYDIISEDEFGNETKMRFQPLYKLDTAYDKTWCENWLCNILLLNGLKVTAIHRTRIKEAIKDLAKWQGDDRRKRTMSNLHTLIQDPELKDIFVNYTKSDSVGEIFDGEEYKVDMARYTVFEMRSLLTLADKKIIVPVIEFLFKVIEDKISTQSSPSIIILDEAWVFLDNEAFRDKIKGWLKEMRKYNCSVIFATQSLEEAFNSSIANTLFQECPTKIMLPNQEANNPTSRRYYEQIGLNDNEIDIIQSSTPKRHYYLMKVNNRRLIDLGLEKRPALLALIANSGIEINKLAKRYKEEFEDEFAYYWWEMYQDKKGVDLSETMDLWQKKFIEMKNEELKNGI